MKRELLEELDLNIIAEKYLGAIENYFSENDCHNHEICHVFFCVSNEIEKLNNLISLEDHLEFLWSDISDLYKNNLLPPALQTLIPELLNGNESAWWESNLEK